MKIMGGNRKEWLIAILLSSCICILAFWQVSAYYSSKQAPPLKFKASDFEGFSPVFDGYSVDRLTVGTDPLEPNILVYRLIRKSSPSEVFHVRLVHGYNMRDCLRIKGFDVKLVDEKYDLPGSQFGEGRLQTWRVEGEDKRFSVWSTRMIRAFDLTAVKESVTDMAFPRVGIPDDPGWMPRGFTWRSLRHPIRNLRLFMRSKWNSSRCDLLTFLGLKRPAWASDELLTVVAASSSHFPDEMKEADYKKQINNLINDFLFQLVFWNKSRQQHGVSEQIHSANNLKSFAG